jgi:hypothetical protein
MRRPSAAEEADDLGGVGRRCGGLRPLRRPTISAVSGDDAAAFGPIAQLTTGECAQSV